MRASYILQKRGVAELGLVGVAYELLGIWGGLNGRGGALQA